MTTPPGRAYLLDVNVLIALIDEDHDLHRVVRRWFDGKEPGTWSVSPFSEAGFVRIVTSPVYSNPFSMNEALEVLQAISDYRGYRFCPVTDSLATLVQPFVDRLFGHQQVTDSYLLGLAIQMDGVLVTGDKGIRAMAGPNYAKHVLVLEQEA